MLSCSVVSTLCDCTDCSPPGSCVNGTSQARILEWLAFPTPRDLPDSGIEPRSPASPPLAGKLFTTEPPVKPKHIHYIVKSKV